MTVELAVNLYLNFSRKSIPFEEKFEMSKPAREGKYFFEVPSALVAWPTPVLCCFLHSSDSFLSKSKIRAGVDFLFCFDAFLARASLLQTGRVSYRCIDSW